jgi:hypothetical protein
MACGQANCKRRFKGPAKNPDFIPTAAATSHSTKLSKDDSQVAGYAALREKFLAYISIICGAAKFSPRLAFGRTLNF